MEDGKAGPKCPPAALAGFPGKQPGGVSPWFRYPRIPGHAQMAGRGIHSGPGSRYIDGAGVRTAELADGQHATFGIYDIATD